MGYSSAWFTLPLRLLLKLLSRSILLLLLLTALQPYCQASPSDSCFHSFTYIDDKCTTSPQADASSAILIPPELGQLYLDQMVHRVNVNSGHCAQGLVTVTSNPSPSGEIDGQLRYTATFDFPRSLGCTGLQGENRYCPGPCPNNLFTGGGGGPNTCTDPIDFSSVYTCTENAQGQATFDLETPCYPTYNDRLVFSKTGQQQACYAATCTGQGIFTVPEASCGDLTGILSFCINRDCSNMQRRRRHLIEENKDTATENHPHPQQRNLLTTIMATLGTATTLTRPQRGVQVHDAVYQEYASKCGNVIYDVHLLIEGGHFYAVAWPQHQQTMASSSQQQPQYFLFRHRYGQPRCPTYVTQAEYKNVYSYYTKVLTIVPPPASTIGNRQQNSNNYQDRDTHYMGTFTLDELRLAFEGIDPTQSPNNKVAYNVITNNCADFLLDLANALQVPTVNDAATIWYVTRKLWEQLGMTLVNQIVSSSRHAMLHQYSSLFASSPSTEQQPMGNGEQVIQSLVYARVNHLV